MNTKKGYIGNIEKETIGNDYFRKVIFTGPKSQLVVMALKPGEEIGMEKHADTDQFIRIEAGEAKIILDGEERAVRDDFAIVIPAGTYHNVINTSSDKPLKLYTVYAPPEHAPNTIHKTKAEADLAHEH